MDRKLHDLNESRKHNRYVSPGFRMPARAIGRIYERMAQPIVDTFVELATEQGTAAQRIEFDYVSHVRGLQTAVQEGWEIIAINPRRQPGESVRNPVTAGLLVVTSDRRLVWLGNYELPNPDLDWLRYVMVEALEKARKAARTRA